MLKNTSRYFLVIVLLFAATNSAAYTIKGTIKNVDKCFYPRLYLEVIKDIDGFYATSYQNTITYTDIHADGSFIIQGKELPEEHLFYRLYVTQDAYVRSSIHTGSKRNYILLLLNNQSEIIVNCDDFCKDYFNYTASSAENNAIRNVQQLSDAYFFSMRDSVSDSKKEFLTGAYKKDLKSFADTCSNALAGLFALVQMGIETHYDTEASYFNAFLNRLEKEYPNSVYTGQFSEKLELIHLKEQVKNGSGMGWLYFIYAALGCSLALNIFFILKSKKRADNKTATPKPASNDDEKQARDLIDNLSIKEREILQMVHEGLSNKEIADRQHVEVSTIKTHVSRIYQKTGIKSRKEVASIIRNL